MQINRAIAAWMFTVAALGSPAEAISGPGHDHGEPAKTSTAGAAAPRFTATSETFELVGVLDDKRLTLYLDRAIDNTPVGSTSYVRSL